MARKASGLNYDEELAIPMPKPRPRREHPMDENSPGSTETPRLRLLKKRSLPDAVHGKTTPSPVTSADEKKKTPLDALKSKLSFRDLHKEAAKDDGPAGPRLPSIDEQSGSQRSATPTRLPVYSPTLIDLSGRTPNPVQTATSPTVPTVSPLSPAQHNPAQSRIPLVPSGTYTHAQGSMTSSKPSAGQQRVDSLGQVKAAAERVETQENLSTATKGIPIPTEKHKPSPSFEVSALKSSLLVPKPLGSDYAPTGDSPPTLSDFTEGSGKVKYLPRDWLNKSSPSSLSPTVRSMHQASALYRERAPSLDWQSMPMPGLEERLDDISLSLNKPTPPERENLSMGMHVKEVVDMVQGIQQQADSEIRDLTQKVVDLSKWMHGQLANQVERLSDLESTNTGVLSQQAELQRDITKFKQVVDIKINLVNQRLDSLERKVQNDLEAEMQSLAISVQELTQKIEDAIEKSHAQSPEASIIRDKQQEKINETEETKELRQKQANQPQILPDSNQAERFVSGSTIASAEPLITQTDLPIPPMRVSPMPRSVTATPTHQREAASAESRTSSGFTRSASIKKGLAKVASIPPGSQSKLHKRVNSGDESKKWKLFGFRQRRDAHSDGSNGASKFSWLHRRSKDGQVSDSSSSRSETPPPPPVPRHIQQNIENNIRAASEVHPARRNLIQQTVMQDESLLSPSSPFHSAAMPSRMSRLPRPDSQNIGGITVSIAPISASPHDRGVASGEMLSPNRCRQPSDPFNQSPTTPGSNPSFEYMRDPFHGEEEEIHDWDQCSHSLHEAQSIASL